MDNNREKLVELMQYAKQVALNKCKKYYNCVGCPVQNRCGDGICHALLCADELIANGVMFVVPCEDCKHCELCYPEKQIGKEATPEWYCKVHKCYYSPDYFCGYGEPKNE